MALLLTRSIENLLAATLGVALATSCGGGPSESNLACATDDDCADELRCNGVESCNGGQCAPGEPIACQAQDACHVVGTCSERTGRCSNPVAADGTTCDDGSACTTGDACSSGVCRGMAVKCAAIPCHSAGVCDAATGLCKSQPVADGSGCNDGNVCTTGDACVVGECKGVAVVCAASNVCHDAGTCDPSTGACSSPLKPNGTACDDGNACTTGDTCAAGGCQGTPVVCSAVNSCRQIGVCDPATGACSSPPQPDGSACDDGNGCTTGDACVTGDCKGVLITCAAIDACHQVGTCNPSTGLCSSLPQPDVTGCDDGNTCTTGDVCIAGTCAGTPVVCPAIDACHQAGLCIPATGLCGAGTTKPDGAECDDGNPCSATSACAAGTCAATGAATDGTDCDDKDGCSTTSTCQAGLCKPATSVADDTPCSDGSDCTVIDTCRAGHCIGNHARVCGGTQDSCPLPGMCVPSCGDGVLAATEACDEPSGADDGCTADCKLKLAPDDYDVSGVGSIFAVYVTGNALMGRCFGPSGKSRGAAFEIAAGPVAMPQVVTARTTERSLVSYLLDAGSGTWVHTSRLYDSACQPVGAAFAWDTPASSSSTFDATIDADGNAVVLWTEVVAGVTSAYLAFYDPSGTPVGPELTIDAASRCENGYGKRVVVSPSSGWGVVTCQKHASDPIYYRRFHNRAFIDSSMLEVPGTLGRSSWYESHSVAMNDAGDFLIVWQNYGRRSYEAALLSSFGAESKTFTLGWATGNGYDGFLRGTRAIQLHGADFAIMDGEAPNRTVRLVSATGEHRGCDVEVGSLLRTGGLTTTYTVNSGIQRASVDFSSWNGCQRPTCGNGARDPGEDCDDGNLEPFDGCSEYCKAESCGDGLVTDGEDCDDGALLPSASCSSTCQWTAKPLAAADQFPSGSLDFDVASDGTFVDTYIEENRIWVRCYGPDRKSLRQAFPVSPLRNYESAEIVLAWSSKRSLVAWLQDGMLWGTALDAACKRVGSPQVLIQDATDHEGWEIAVDGEGRFAAAAIASDGQLHVALFDPAGVRQGLEQISSFEDPLFAPRIAMNRVSGAGVVAVQKHSGKDAVFYRRFDAAGSWVDPGFVTVPVSYVYWYAGYTVGMNALGDFVVEYRGEKGPMEAVFYRPDGVATGPVTFSARVRTGETIFYDSFRGYRSPIPLKGDNFVLGEAYEITSIPAEATTNYFVYEPSGSLMSSYESQWSDGMLTARLDGNGVSYFREYDTVYFGSGRL